MQSVTLYGKGALALQHDREIIRSADGQIVVPPNLVDAVIAAGWSRTPPDPEVSATSDVLVLVTGNDETGEPPVSIQAKALEELRAVFEKEVADAGYTGEVAAGIVDGRLRHVKAGGDGSQDIPEEPTEIVKLEKIDVAAIEGGKQIEGAEPSVEDQVDALESGAPELVDGPFAGIEQGAGDEMTKAVANPDDVKLNEYIAALTAGFSADEAKSLVWPDGDAPAVLPALTAGE